MRESTNRLMVLVVGVFALVVLVATAALPAIAKPAASSLHGDLVLSKLSWRSVGPYIGGRVVAVAGDARDSDVFYMGSVDGGVWRSDDYGVSWNNLSDGWPSSSDSIGALAVAPSAPKVIYAGTGESDIRGDMITGDGIYKTTNGGKTWHYAGLKQTHTTTSLVVDPKDANIVYAASMGHVFVPGAHRGVFKTTDGGKTWHRILFVNDRTGVVDLVMDPKDSSVLYAAAWQAYRKPWRLSSGGPGSGLYKTTDGGQHWVNISDHPGLPTEPLGKIGIAVAASNPNVVYVVVQAKHGGLFRSQDGGRTFNRVNAHWKLRNRGFYFTTVFVDPTDPNAVYMPQVDALFVSHDGGKTFRALHTPHGDNHVLWINPHNPRILLEGNDGGATVSTNAGRTWSSEHNQPTGQFYHVNLDHEFPFHIYGAQQDEASFEGPSASSEGRIPLSAWHRVAYGESTWVVPQPNSPAITYGSGYFGVFMKYNMAISQYQSVSPWPDKLEGASSRELKYRFAWTHPILFSSTNPSELLIGSQYVMRSDDYGETWRTISPDLTRNVPRTEAPTGGPIELDQTGAEIYPYVSALAISPLDGKVIWAGSSDGLVHVTTDDGKQWHAVRPPMLPKWCKITSIEPSHINKGTAYLTASRYMWDDFKPYVFKTTDYGQHWAVITRGLPRTSYALAVRQDPEDANLLFLGTKNTVFVSFDAGDDWQPLTLNLPKVQVRDIAIDTREGDVVAATHGRSFWVLDDLAFLEQLAKHPKIAPESVALFAPQSAWLTHAYGRSQYHRGQAASGKNPRFGATVFFHIPANYAGKRPVTLTFTDAEGRVVRTFSLHPKRTNQKKEENPNMTPAQRRDKAEVTQTAIEPGMNRFQWDLRYPDATHVHGIYSAPAEGPTVTPGTYHVTIDYGGKKSEKRFAVLLDPRIHTKPSDLEARLTLQKRILHTLTTLDKTVNQALKARQRLESDAGGSKVGASAYTRMDKSLNEALGTLIQLDVHSSRGTRMHESKLYRHLIYLEDGIDRAYVKPTTAQYEVFRVLHHKVTIGEGRLRTAIANAMRMTATASRASRGH